MIRPPQGICLLCFHPLGYFCHIADVLLQLCVGSIFAQVKLYGLLKVNVSLLTVGQEVEHGSSVFVNCSDTAVLDALNVNIGIFADSESQNCT